MRKLLFLIGFYFFCQNVVAQKILREDFEFKGTKYSYSLITAKSRSVYFNIVIVGNDIANNDVEKTIKICSSKNKGSVYYLVIPEKEQNEKESLVLEFICDVLSKRKLIDKEMNVISDGNYVALYEKTKVSSRSKYKNCFLNKISNQAIISDFKNICKYLK